jgi:hypothetical protein
MDLERNLLARIRRELWRARRHRTKLLELARDMRDDLMVHRMFADGVRAQEQERVSAMVDDLILSVGCRPPAKR